MQIAGINRRGCRSLNPSAEERLQAGDEVLILGAPTQIHAFQGWLREIPAAPVDGGAG